MHEIEFCLWESAEKSESGARQSDCDFYFSDMGENIGFPGGGDAVRAEQSCSALNEHRECGQPAIISREVIA